MSHLLTEPRRTGHEATENWNRVVIPKRVMDRAFAKTVRSTTGCWISTYSVASHGYAQIGWSNRAKNERHIVLAHRAVWERFNGRVPAGMTLDHLCREKRCVNPNHLRLMENFENARRVHGMDWKLGECPNGHSNDFLVEVPELRKNGVRSMLRRCRLCKEIYGRRGTWRKFRPGQPYPEGLLLASERRELGEAA